MIYVCVICMVKRPPLSPLSAEHRTLLEAIVSPVINTADLQTCHSQWLLCDTCKLLMQTVYNFQQTALVGVKHLKYLLLNMNTGPTLIEETKLTVASIKVEPAPDALTTASRDKFITIEATRKVNLLTEELDVKFEPEPPDSDHEPALEPDCDSASTASSESNNTSNIKQPATSDSTPNTQHVTVTQQVIVPNYQQIRVPNIQQMRVSNAQQVRIMPVIAVSEGKFEVFTHQLQPSQKPANLSSIRRKDGVREGAKNVKYVRKKPARVTCPHCGKSIRDNCSLKVHITRLHGEISPCVCDLCGKQCRNEMALKHHKYRETYRKNKTSIIEHMRPEMFCKECCIQFPSPSAYRVHRTTLRHMPREQYAFECETCKEKFLDEKRRQQHIDIVHLRQREQKCDKCDKSFGTPTAARKHKRRVHEKRPRPPVICHLCGKTFTIRKSLHEHLLTHEGLRPHQCPLCPATFTYKAALYTHNRLKHLKIKGKWKKKKKAEKEEVEKGAGNSYEGEGVGELLKTI